jgi:hypothetical protein
MGGVLSAPALCVASLAVQNSSRHPALPTASRADRSVLVWSEGSRGPRKPSLFRCRGPAPNKPLQPTSGGERGENAVALE